MLFGRGLLPPSPSGFGMRWPPCQKPVGVRQGKPLDSQRPRFPAGLARLERVPACCFKEPCLSQPKSTFPFRKRTPLPFQYDYTHPDKRVNQGRVGKKYHLAE